VITVFTWPRVRRRYHRDSGCAFRGRVQDRSRVLRTRDDAEALGYWQ